MPIHAKIIAWVGGRGKFRLQRRRVFYRIARRKVPPFIFY